MLLYYTKFDDVSRGKEKKMEIILPRLAERLKPLRKRFGRTQKDMAELLGVTERHYQKIEYGHINVSATTLILLAECSSARCRIPRNGTPTGFTESC